MAEIKVKPRVVKTTEVKIKIGEVIIPLPENIAKYLDLTGESKIYYTVFDGVLQITTNRTEFALPVFDGNIESFVKG